MSPFLTARVGSNADLFPDILALYVPPGSRVLDMTWGNGVFWKKVTAPYDVVKNDIDHNRGDVHEDFRHTSWPDASFDAVVLDPPYLYVGGFKTLKHSIDRGYLNKDRALAGVYGVDAVHQMFEDGIKEAARLLRPKGVLIVKCMDQVMSGKQQWQHVVVMEKMNAAGVENLDLFVLVQKGQPAMRHATQVHARRNHSYFVVGRKP